VCYYHGAKGGRRRKEESALHRTLELFEQLDKQLARASFDRLAAILEGKALDPVATPAELRTAAMLNREFEYDRTR